MRAVRLRSCLSLHHAPCFDEEQLLRSSDGDILIYHSATLCRSLVSLVSLVSWALEPVAIRGPPASSWS